LVCPFDQQKALQIINGRSDVLFPSFELARKVFVSYRYRGRDVFYKRLDMSNLTWRVTGSLTCHSRVSGP
jgi:hypothetical protein